MPLIHILSMSPDGASERTSDPRTDHPGISMRLTASRLRAIRSIACPRRTARYASTAIQSREEIPVPVAKTPAVRELERLYDILEGQVGGDPVWSERVAGAVKRIEADEKVRVGGTYPAHYFY